MADTTIDVFFKNMDDAFVEYDALSALPVPPGQSDVLTDYPSRYKAVNDVSNALSDLLDSYYAPEDAIVPPDFTSSIDNENIANPVPLSCITATDQSFQGIRFSDGSSSGLLNVYSDHVELVVDETLTFSLDCTVTHTFRVTGKGHDVFLYVDGQLAIDGTGRFTRTTSDSSLEFGAHNSQDELTFDTFRYSVEGAYAPADVQDYVYDEVVALPDGAIAKMKQYNDMLYASLDPNDPSRSSELYRRRSG